MLCERCGKRPATVHVTRIVNEEKSELHVCAECAAQEQQELGFPAEPIHHLLGELLNYEDWFAGRGRPVEAGARCRGCGLTFKQFTRSGLLGCARCYEEFASRLDPLLQRMHGATSHRGKVPRRQGGALSLRRQAESLRQQLEEAVAAEEYERAARLRDQIRELERQLGRRR